MTAVGGIFVDASQRRRFDDLYTRFIGRRLDFHDLVYDSKRRIMALSLASEINVLAWQLNSLSERDRRFRDFTLYALRDALREVIACFPVYRTYITGRPVSERDRAQIEIAVAWARRRNPAGEVSIFQFIRDVLLLEAMDPDDHDGQDLQLQFVQKVQQTTGPVTAKAVEDTVVLHLQPAGLAQRGRRRARGVRRVSVPAFHRLNAERLERWPHSLLSTSTHDTKRSEDVRSRISALSELPREWSAALTRWSRLNRRHKRLAGRRRGPVAQRRVPAVPDAARRLAAGRRRPTRAAPTFVGRIQEYMAKATREAKVHTSWINPNEAYDTAIQQFVAAILDPKRSTPFLTDFARFQRAIARSRRGQQPRPDAAQADRPRRPGHLPGQRAVGPEPGRPGQSPARRLPPAEAAARHAPARRRPRRGHQADAQTHEHPLRRLARRLADEWTDGRVKLYLTWRTLRFRREHPDLFQHGAYLPLTTAGPLEEHLSPSPASSTTSRSSWPCRA